MQELTKNVYLMQTMSYFPAGLNPKKAARMAREAGFDGLEVIDLFGILRGGSRHLAEFRRECDKLQLVCHYHQLWGLNQNRDLPINWLFAALGAIPINGDNPIRQFGDERDVPLVLYPKHCDWAKDCTRNRWVQTVSTQKNGELEMFYSELVNYVRQYELGVILDNQHALELYHSLLNVTGLPSNPEILLGVIKCIWEDLGEFIRELHVCNFNPAGGKTAGRNLDFFDPSGVFPIHAYADMIRSTGRFYYIVPEFKPNIVENLTFRDALARFSIVNQQARGLFG